MSVNYQVDAGGQTATLSPSQIMSNANQALQGTGKQVLSVTPDGLTATVQEGQNTGEVPISRILSLTGMQVQSIMPSSESVSYDSVNPSWRYAISNLEDDAQRKFYLKNKLQDMGLTSAEIIGQGRDFFAYDPASGQYRALTNSPDWDLSDLAELGTEAGRVIPAIAGTTLGAVGGLPGAMAGGAGGSALGETVTRGLAALDPDYQSAFDMQRAVEEGGTSAALSGGLAGLGGVFGKLLQRGGSAVGNLSTPVSSTARGVGAVTSGAGKVAQMGQLGATGAGKTFGAALTPGLGEAQLAGWLGQAPSWLTRQGARGAQWVAKRTSPQSRLAREGAGEGAEEILGRVGRAFAGGGKAKATRGGINLTPERNITEEAARGAAGESFGRTMGRGLEALGRGGRALERGAEEIFGGVARGAAATGRGMVRAGEGLRSAGAAAARYEPAAWQQIGGRAGTGQYPGMSPQLSPGMPMAAPQMNPYQVPYGNMPNPFGQPRQGFRPIPINYSPKIIQPYAEI